MCRSTLRFLAVGPGGLYEMAPPGSFKYYLRKATRALYDAFFNGDHIFSSKAVGWRGVSPELASDGETVLFFNDDPANDMFDRDFWHAVYPDAGEETDGNPRVLQVLPDKQPADAVAAIIERPTRWGVDCDYIVQFANLYALCMTLGPTKFNQRIAAAIPPTRNLSNQHMRVRPRDSDGMKTIFHFGRDMPADDWKVVLSYDNARVKTKPDDLTVQTVGPFQFGAIFAPASETQAMVGRALSGSRIRLTNLKTNVGKSFRHENSVKLEYDLFAGGGLVDSLTGNEFDGARLAAELAAHEGDATVSVKDDIFIDEIEVFDQG